MANRTKLQVFVALIALLVLGGGLLLMPGVTARSAPADPVTIYLESGTTFTATVASASTRWTGLDFGTPTMAEVYVTVIQSTPVNTVAITVQTSPDNSVWATHNTPAGRDLDVDTDAGVLVAATATAGTNTYYWDGPIHGRYFRVYYTMTGTTTVTVTTIAVLH